MTRSLSKVLGGAVIGVLLGAALGAVAVHCPLMLRPKSLKNRRTPLARESAPSAHSDPRWAGATVNSQGCKPLVTKREPRTSPNGTTESRHWQSATTLQFCRSRHFRPVGA